MSRCLLKRFGSLALLLALFAGEAQAGDNLPAPDQELPERPRLVLLQVDGLSPLLLDALIDPTEENLARLPDPEGFRRAIHLFRLQTGQQDLLPNLQRYFYEQGVRARNVFSATTTLSSVAWGVMHTGQPSVVKRHMSFNRNNGFLRSHLDGFRDTWDFSFRRGRKTNALWELDQAGVSLLSDAFHPMRRYETPQIYYRLTPRDYLVGLSGAYTTGGRKFSDPFGILRVHLTRQVEGMDYPDFAEEFVADHIAEKILEQDFAQSERYDFITLLLSVDHQHHVDPNPENLVHRLVRLDRRIGRMLRAVERSRRRDHTLVALVSDHGSEYEPGAINLAFPITRVFRTSLLGGHNVATVMAEDAGRALSTPVPGVDFPRLYESPFSPYGEQAGGESGYSTAFIDNFGNARAEVHLRNNDLNRLHLLLLARGRQLDENQRGLWRDLFRETTAKVCRWLPAELASYRDYYEGVRAWLPTLKQRADPYWKDAAARLKDENGRDGAQLRTLGRLEQLCTAAEPVAWLTQQDPKVPDLIPKKYFGPRNSIYQLTHYTVGLDEELEWVETVIDQRGRQVPMNYFQVLSNYRAPNPPVSHEPNPVDLIVTALPIPTVRAALVERGWLEPRVELEQAVWIVSTAQHNLRRGDQALLLQATDGSLRYLPLNRLLQLSDGSLRLEPHRDLDPLGLLYHPGFRSATGLPAFLWLEHFHSADQWLRATCKTAYTVAPLIFADIAGLHTTRFIRNPDFRQALSGFPTEDAKQRYLRGLAWKYASQGPDLLLWSSYLWNFSSKSHTSGGSHGGLREHVTRTTLLLWGGRNIPLTPGAVLEEPATTLDIAPTLAVLLGMLDEDGRIIARPGAVRERPFLPFPGHALLPGDAQWARRTQTPTAPPRSAPVDPED